MLRIGDLTIDPPILLAPMAAVTNLPMRTLCEEAGAGFTLTEFLPAHAVARGVPRILARMTASLGGRPFGVQIFGREPKDLASAARAAHATGASLVDINMGCPAKAVVSGACGSALMRTPELAAELVAAVREAIAPLPVTVKIRAGWDDTHRNAPEFAARMAQAGARWITVHGRTRTQGFSGQADWTLIAEVKRTVSVPVVANGDVVDAESFRQVLEVTGCDGVMIGRGALGNPWIFRRLACIWRGEPDPGPPTVQERWTTLKRHYALYLETVSKPQAVREMRKHVGWYTKGLPRSAEFRDAVNHIDDPQTLMSVVDSYFAGLASSAPPSRRIPSSMLSMEVA